MIFYLVALYLLTLVKISTGGLDPFITGGEFTKYNKYPHAVFLNIRTPFEIVCGGSVINQEIILTAAHCMDDCHRRGTTVNVKYGHEDIYQMKYVRMKQFIIHGDYDESKLLNDIALLSTMRKIPLNVVKRVILMKSPPRVKYAYVSGWGNDEFDQLQLTLKHTNALMQTENVCKTMGWLPPGVFCAGPVTGIGAAEVGDSGGALIINGIIQIGLVSYKMDSKSLVGYTNVSYFLDWIRRNSKRLYCVG